MALADLTVLNRSTPDRAPTALLPEACVLGTCLREVRIAIAVSAGTTHRAVRPMPRGYERYAGAEAYRFLLQLACGLESEIAGETEILGQIKQAWRDYETAQPEAAKALRPWMQRLLQDTKEIRSEYVVSLGSATYGSLVRRLLGGTLTGPTLLIGAGQLAETILPFLDTGEVLVWNRSRERSAAMLSRQRACAGRRAACSCWNPPPTPKTLHGVARMTWWSASRADVARDGAARAAVAPAWPASGPRAAPGHP